MVARCKQRKAYYFQFGKRVSLSSAKVTKVYTGQSLWTSVLRCFLSLQWHTMASVLGFGTSVTGRSVNSVGVPEPDARLVACEKALYYIMQSVEVRSQPHSCLSLKQGFSPSRMRPDALHTANTVVVGPLSATCTAAQYVHCSALFWRPWSPDISADQQRRRVKNPRLDCREQASYGSD